MLYGIIGRTQRLCRRFARRFKFENVREWFEFQYWSKAISLFG